MKRLNLKTVFTICVLFTTTLLLSQDLLIYVSDAGNFNSPPWQIVKFDENGNNPEVFIDENLGWPQDIVFLENDNTVLISNLTTGTITRYNATTGDYIDDFATSIGGPTRMKIGTDNLLYVLQWSGSGKVLRYNLDGTFVDEYTDVGVTQSIGMDWDNNGNLYVSSYSGGYVRQFDASGNNMGLFIDTNLSGPTNIKIKEAVMYVLDWNLGKVARFEVSNGNFIDDFITILTNPEGIAFLPNGYLLVGDNGTNSVRMFDNGGNDQGDYTHGGNLLTPNAVVLRDPNLSVLEFEFDANFLIQTIGTVFYIIPNLSQDIKSIAVYNSLGVLIYNNELENNQAWNASNYAEGFYFIVAKTFDGNRNTQKIIVKK